MKTKNKQTIPQGLWLIFFLLLGVNLLSYSDFAEKWYYQNVFLSGSTESNDLDCITFAEAKLKLPKTSLCSDFAVSLLNLHQNLKKHKSVSFQTDSLFSILKAQVFRLVYEEQFFSFLREAFRGRAPPFSLFI